MPWDRTAGVIGPQGSGKTLDLLTPALLGAPGAALVTLTKVEDLLLSLTGGPAGDRPCVVLDPFGLAEGCGPGSRSWSGTRSPAAWTRRSPSGAPRPSPPAPSRVRSPAAPGDDAARFYAAESAKVLQALLPRRSADRQDPRRRAALGGQPGRRDRADGDPAPSTRTPSRSGTACCTVRSTATTGPPATRSPRCSRRCRLFFQADIRRRCVPGHGRPATDLADVIRRGGTIYLLGREDPYASASPLMTAVAEHVLDTGLAAGQQVTVGRPAVPAAARVLDELPSTAPLPTLRTRMANERALGLSFIWAAQTRPQLTASSASTRPGRCSASPTSW